jgi:hypothetical protein
VIAWEAEATQFERRDSVLATEAETYLLPKTAQHRRRDDKRLCTA